MGLGGALGSLARWSLAEVTPAPWGTFVANLTGCLVIGVLAGWLFVRHPHLRLLLGVGFLGGCTTFSAHLLDAHELLDEPVALTAYVGGTLVASMLAAWGGLVVGRRLHRVTS